MKLEFISPFVDGAARVLKMELGSEIEKGSIAAERTSLITEKEITALIAVTGQLQGVVMYSFSERTAKNMAGKMLGEIIPIFNSLVESGIAELANVITGSASALLEGNGYVCDIAPPTMVVGKGVIISTVNIPMLKIEINTDYGSIIISVGLKEKAN